MSENTYILVSPVKDEEQYIERTIHAVLAQTVRPYKWIVVDDGSRDRTRSIVERYGHQYSWITVVSLPTGGVRQPGSGIIRAFNVGYKAAKELEFDFIVKFDCDIEFPPDYFERLIAEFHKDDKLGIASGIYLEEKAGEWEPVKMPAYHAAGQTKVVRAACFEEIGGFVESRGWDTIDEIRAREKGWNTRHFEELYFLHLKKEGSGIGFLRTNVMHGEIFYLTGGSGSFFALKLLHRFVFGRPFIVGGIMMLYGFMKSWCSKRPKLVSKPEERLYRHMLHQRIIERLSGSLAL